jgi:hypothetical protein
MQWLGYTTALSQRSIGLLAHFVSDVEQTRNDAGLDQYGQGCQANEYRQKVLIDHDALKHSFTLTAIFLLTGFDSFIDALFAAFNKVSNGRARAAPLLHVLFAFLNLFRNQIHAAMGLRRNVVSQLIPRFGSEKDPIIAPIPVPATR